ncbi:hypothetical protein HWQ46_04210 [Shewanella sp. D64]|uniref:hypothetical protein n=1 Tax=unclassified Shewanella TaxID=196818 RepID=UPI0022BA39F8|nr:MULTISPECIES: hypothetical protein [unclassified Shewanella]MEC4724751.1 hypothetical protein [Shewanella sp. D64]MEC4736455.1 hypothetical protein [Shewanella sp. E94]WBJ97488.1 hypothetical protein HWQ47_10585 [Shewanella sp. MTB7]
MNALVEFEAGKLVDLFDEGDSLNIHMFMDMMKMPYDVQDKLFFEISSLQNVDRSKIAIIIESHGQSILHERLGY